MPGDFYKEHFMQCFTDGANKEETLENENKIW